MGEFVVVPKVVIDELAEKLENAGPDDWHSAGRDVVTAAAPQPEAEPVFWYRPLSDGGWEGPVSNGCIGEVRKLSGAWVPLYAHPPVQDDIKRLVRELDVLLNGEGGAAQQASLCDIVAQVRKTGTRIAPKQPAPVLSDERTSSMHLTLSEIKDLAEFAGFNVQISDSEWCDGETEFVVEEGTLPCCDDDGTIEYYRHRMYMAEYPEEGCIPLGGAMTAPRKPAEPGGGA